MKTLIQIVKALIFAVVFHFIWTSMEIGENLFGYFLPERLESPTLGEVIALVGIIAGWRILMPASKVDTTPLEVDLEAYLPAKNASAAPSEPAAKATGTEKVRETTVHTPVKEVEVPTGAAAVVHERTLPVEDLHTGVGPTASAGHA